MLCQAPKAVEFGARRKSIFGKPRRVAPLPQNPIVARKGVVSETFVSYSPSMPNGTLACSQKRTDSKNGPYFGRLGSKTGYEHGEKNTLFCTFSRFGGFLRL